MLPAPPTASAEEDDDDAEDADEGMVEVIPKGGSLYAAARAIIATSNGRGPITKMESRRGSKGTLAVSLHRSIRQRVRPRARCARLYRHGCRS